MVLSAATFGASHAEDAQAPKKTPRQQSSFACEYACQLDLGPCKRSGGDGCDERYRQCVAACNK